MSSPNSPLRRCGCGPSFLGEETLHGSRLTWTHPAPVWAPGAWTRVAADRSSMLFTGALLSVPKGSSLSLSLCLSVSLSLPWKVAHVPLTYALLWTWHHGAEQRSCFAVLTTEELWYVEMPVTEDVMATEMLGRCSCSTRRPNHSSVN